MTETCRKCGIRDRAVGHQWCNACQTAARKERRALKRGLPVSVEGVSNAGPVVVQPAVQCPTCPTLRGEIERLRTDVANLKRDLAEAHTRLENVVTFTRDEVAVSVGGPRGGRALTPPKQAMPGHPPGRCFKTACWCKA